MQEHDIEQFSELLTDVMAFYGKDTSEFAVQVWWSAVKRFELPEIRRALSIHAQDPDTGQFPPKPADVVRALSGGKASAALQAWSKVEKTIRCVGSYESVCFDDHAIHAVLSDMGGWVEICKVLEKELPFKAREFERRYQGYAMQGGAKEYPKSLTGMVEADGRNVVPVMIGDRHRARLVY
ncbi:MAG: hypothetical protein GY938_07705, partial [Ketobacter sp.]|nr:hypothetical protein [Ketobacter sp.]